MSLILPAVLGGRYELLDEIGTGAFAAVYRAHDHVLNRPVAVKVLRDEVTSDETFARFEREVHVTATLEHAHILHVHDSGKHEGRPYIVTEYAPGGTLSEKLAREGQLQIADALQIACEVGIALAHAHASGVVHRDVKPDNILLGRGGVLLADFGIAISDTDEFRTRLTRTGMAVGTVQYMSPEQLCAERDVDGRSDQYALACVLYEMLAGVRPHVAATVEGLRLQRLAGQHLSLRAHRPNVPAQIDTAIIKALSSMAADRYRDMATFLAALGMAGSGEFALMAAAVVPGTTSSSQVVSPQGASLVHDEESRAGALTSSAGDGGRGRVRRLPRFAVALGVAAALALALAAVRNASSEECENSDFSSRPMCVMLASPAGDDESSAVQLVHGILRQELAAWPGVQVADRIGDDDTSAIHLVPSIASIGDSVRVSLTIRRGTPSAEQLASGIAMIRDTVALRALGAQLVREALSGADADRTPGLHALPRRSMEALQSYVEAHRLLREGLLDSASNSFRRAAQFSGVAPRFAHAHFWAAQTLAWSAPRSPEAWRDDIEIALGSRRMRGVDSLLAAALQHMARGEYPSACALYDGAAALEPASFVALYGRGECARLDQAIEMRGQRSYFRSSIWSALATYRRAIDVAPSPALLAALFPPILQSTFAEGNRGRIGIHGSSPGERYSALPSLEGDTLAFYPVARSAMEQMQTSTVPPTFAAALRRGRSVALELTDRWVSRSPEAPEAWYFHAYALELAGRLKVSSGEQHSAQTAIERAALGAPSAVMRARIAVAQTRILLRQGEFGRAVQVAHKAVSDTTPQPADAGVLLAPLAALIGDLSQLEKFAAPSARADIPVSLLEPLDAFQHRAWSGACEELDSLRTTIEQRARSLFSPSELPIARAALLTDPYRDAVPCLGPAVVAEFEPRIPLERAYRAMSAANYAEARRLLEGAHAARGGASNAAVSWDFLFMESWALAQAGDSAGARARLAGALDDIASMNGYTLDLIAQAAGLRRGLLLLRKLCEGAEVNESTARWASRADAFLQRQTQGDGK